MKNTCYSVVSHYKKAFLSRCQVLAILRNHHEVLYCCCIFDCLSFCSFCSRYEIFTLFMKQNLFLFSQNLLQSSPSFLIELKMVHQALPSPLRTDTLTLWSWTGILPMMRTEWQILKNATLWGIWLPKKPLALLWLVALERILTSPLCLLMLLNLPCSSGMPRITLLKSLKALSRYILRRYNNIEIFDRCPKPQELWSAERSKAEETCAFAIFQDFWPIFYSRMSNHYSVITLNFGQKRAYLQLFMNLDQFFD